MVALKSTVSTQPHIRFNYRLLLYYVYHDAQYKQLNLITRQWTTKII